MDSFNHRKAAACLRLVRADGMPLAGARVTIDQTQHQFLFGCGAFDAVALMKTQDAERKAFLAERMRKWQALFNYGTLPFYWGRYEPAEGQTAYATRCAGIRPARPG